MRKQTSKKNSCTSNNFSIFDKEIEFHHIGFSNTILKKKKQEKLKQQKQKQEKEKKEPLFRGVRSSLCSPKNSVKKFRNKQNAFNTVFATQKISPTSTPLDLQPKKIKSREDYRFIYQVGSGGFGRVWKVQAKKDNMILAMKQISKAKVLMKKSLNSVVNQKQILQKVQNPFIINMKHAFQDRSYLYLTMEYLRGGDLRYHLCYYQFFNEEQTKFIVACIVLGLQYIHNKGIIHRDLKPQNLVFEENGYLRITDFGVARKRRTNNAEQTSGTPGYMAPQVICRSNHSFEADFFALGVIVYQMMIGVRPYMGDSRKQIRDKILAHQAKLTQKDLPLGWSTNVMDFVNRLIKRNKESRLGFNGIQQIKTHSWLRSINWGKMASKSIRPPFVPGNIAQSPQYQREMENTEVSQPNQEALMLLRTDQIQNLFKSYDQSTGNVTQDHHHHYHHHENQNIQHQLLNQEQQFSNIHHISHGYNTQNSTPSNQISHGHHNSMNSTGVIGNIHKNCNKKLLWKS